jgi:hypothetical protein
LQSKSGYLPIKSVEFTSSEKGINLVNVCHVNCITHAFFKNKNLYFSFVNICMLEMDFFFHCGRSLGWRTNGFSCEKFIDSDWVNLLLYGTLQKRDSIRTSVNNRSTFKFKSQPFPDYYYYCMLKSIIQLCSITKDCFGMKFMIWWVNKVQDFL